MNKVNLTLATAISLALTACGVDVHEHHYYHNTGAANDGTTQLAAAGAENPVTPVFRAAPFELDEPEQTDSENGHNKPVTEFTLADNAVSTGSNITTKTAGLGSTAPTAPTSLKVYTPAQIRAAYGLPPVPNDVTNLSADAAADLGAGQTIYIVSVYHNPTAINDLTKFNTQFGLPQCTSSVIPPGTTVLPPANKNGCEVLFAYPVIGKKLSSTPPKYDTAWAQEIALDLQWAHAIAPLARIVVIEGINSFVNTLYDGIFFANRFGPGVVSMSWVAAEGPYVQSYEPVLFNTPGMTYISASGDFGPQNNWPATSPSVLAVGGTSLDSVSGNTRVESAWNKSGGGFSLYFQQPTYQTGFNTFDRLANKSAKPRGTSDVSFNANPYTGQYTSFTNSKGVQSWYSMGGTSIGTPQWAGLIAIANAKRALVNKGPLGKFHTALYSTIGPGLGAAGNSLSDITTGTTSDSKNNTCFYCYALRGYDNPTGWGSPNANNLLPFLVSL